MWSKMDYKKIFLLFLIINACSCIDIQHLGQSRQVIHILNTEICVNKSDIEHLRLWGAEIHTIETNALHSCTKLKNIWLEDNLLTVLRSETFKYKPHLVELNLRANKLEHLDEDVFDGLSALETLNLRCNKLVFFSPRHIQDLMVLKYLNLASNHLINLEINGLLDQLPQLGFISYNGNDISCSRHAVISSKINATGIVMGDLHCEELLNPDLIESTSSQYTYNPHYCMPDDKWDLRSTEVIARIDALKKKYEKK